MIGFPWGGDFELNSSACRVLMTILFASYSQRCQSLEVALWFPPSPSAVRRITQRRNLDPFSRIGRVPIPFGGLAKTGLFFFTSSNYPPFVTPTRATCHRRFFREVKTSESFHPAADRCLAFNSREEDGDEPRIWKSF